MDKPVHNKGMKVNGNELLQDFGIIAISVVVAILLVQNGIIEQFVALTKDTYIIGSFIAGILFTSAFTLPISTVALVEIANESGHPFIVSSVGALGAVIGDLLLFYFIRDNLAKNLQAIFSTPKLKRLSSVFHLKMFRWITPLIGALIIISPLPDELGLALLGLAHFKATSLIPISLSMNFLGILAITYFLHF